MSATQSMPRVLLKKLIIKNLGPITEDEVILEPFTYFVGRNNAGKSHYLRAIEILLATKNPNKDDVVKLQHDKTKEIVIEGHFEGVASFTGLVTVSNHKQAIDDGIQGGILRVVRVLDPNDEQRTCFGIYKQDGTIHNPGGFNQNLLKVLPEPISIIATADTIEELKNKDNTALGKLKKEAMSAFFMELKVKTQEALTGLDEFLHSQEAGRRSQELVEFEQHLKEELMGEFADVVPSIEFGLPDEEVIAKEMRIFLDDGYRSEVEQKGHGLQRATLLALLRLLAKYGARYQDKPTPIFLIGELESFLHPYAQKQLGNTLTALVERYQIVTTTHSPFIISGQNIGGYRRVGKDGTAGTRSVTPMDQGVNLDLIKRHLERRGNLEGLFADRIILIEGTHDEPFFERVRTIFRIQFPARKFTLFVKSGGKEELRQAKKFYQQMGFDDVAIICDLDYLFSNDIKHLLSEFGVDENYSQQLRQHIGWTEAGDPPLVTVVQRLQEKGEPKFLQRMLSELQGKRLFVLRRGSPEMYYRNAVGQKDGFLQVNSEADLLDAESLRDLMTQVLS